MDSAVHNAETTWYWTSGYRLSCLVDRPVDADFAPVASLEDWSVAWSFLNMKLWVFMNKVFIDLPFGDSSSSKLEAFTVVEGVDLSDTTKIFGETIDERRQLDLSIVMGEFFVEDCAFLDLIDFFTSSFAWTMHQIYTIMMFANKFIKLFSGRVRISVSL